MARILGIGECMVEMAPREDGGFAMGYAGDTMNTCWYARRIGGDTLRVGYLTAVGDDAVSTGMLDFLRNAGIEPHAAIRPGRSVGLYLISLAQGERSFSYWRESSAARSLHLDLSALERLDVQDLAFFSGITLAILPPEGRSALTDALSRARARGVTIAFDSNIRPKLWPNPETLRSGIMAGAEVADIVLPSHDDESEHFGDADPETTARRYADAGAMLVAVKNSAEAVTVLNDGAWAHVAPATDPQIVDTTAAGDSFNAGFLVAHLSGASATDAARAGCDLSRRVIAGRGALVPV